jgi:hypothetical protein
MTPQTPTPPTASCSWLPPVRRILGALFLFLVGFASTVAFVSAAPSAAASSNASLTIDLSDYEGHWQRIDDDGGHEARMSAIGHALENLSWIMRKFASPILRKTTTPPIEMNFVWDGQRLFQGVEGKTGSLSRAIDLDGEFVVAKDHRGVDYSSAWTWTDSGLRLRWEQHQAVGNNIYRIDSRDHTLIVEHTIIITAISNVQPIVFRTRFSRIIPAIAPAAGALRGEITLEASAERR